MVFFILSHELNAGKASIRFHVDVLVGAESNGVAVVVDRVAFFDKLPVGDIVEIFVKNFRSAVGVYFRNDCGVAVGEHCAVHHCSADYVDIVRVVLFDFGKKLVQRFDKHITFCIGVRLLSVWIEDDVYAVFKGHSAGEGQKGIAAHNDDLTTRIFDEVAHIRFEIEQQIVVFAQSPFFIDCKYCFHIVFSNQIATSIFFSSFVY